MVLCGREFHSLASPVTKSDQCQQAVLGIVGNTKAKFILTKDYLCTFQKIKSTKVS